MENDGEGTFKYTGTAKEALFQRVKEKSSSHDITILCSDGEIKANKLSLTLASPFFEDLFKSQHSNSGTVFRKKDLKKSILEAFISYLLHGEINLNSLGCQDLIDFIKLISTVGIYNKKLMNDIENCLVHKLKKSPLEDKFEGLRYAHENTRFLLLDKIISKFDFEFIEDKDAIAQLDFKLAKRLLTSNATSIDRLTAFSKWIQAHKDSQDYNDEDVKKIVQTFDTKQFTKDHILGAVNDSGFYIKDDLMRMLGRIIDGLEASCSCSSSKRKREYFEDDEEEPSGPKKRNVDEDLVDLHPKDHVDKEQEEPRESMDQDHPDQEQDNAQEESGSSSSIPKEQPEMNSRGSSVATPTDGDQEEQQGDEEEDQGEEEFAPSTNQANHPDKTQPAARPTEGPKVNTTCLDDLQPNVRGNTEIIWEGKLEMVATINNNTEEPNRYRIPSVIFGSKSCRLLLNWPSKLFFKRFLPSSLLSKEKVLQQAKCLPFHVDYEFEGRQELIKKLAGGFVAEFTNVLLLLSYDDKTNAFKAIIPNGQLIL